ncbi:DinB family protein [Chitinophaga sp. MM2321]|uniref:DinB family protein n=1 Tax=Chitinophaga sp. MM2321 TaxID=3137178 RepID=UPI0032D59745
MKEILVRYASYNHWANQQLVAMLLKLNEEQTDRDLGGSFSTLRNTVLHLWTVESIWYQRLLLIERPIDPATGFTGAFAAACEAWLQQSLQFREWAQSATLARLDHTIAYTRQKSEHYKIEVSVLLMHVFNHSTFHRGQLVHMLRQLGVNKFPATDYRHYKPRK